jgi:citrate synthase
MENLALHADDRVLSLEPFHGCLPADGLAPLDQPGPEGFARVWDPGLARTAACLSAVTWLDGDAGELRYRGYDVAALAESHRFEAVAWLVVHGELPSDAELAAFLADITAHAAAIPTPLRDALALAVTDQTHPMSALQALYALMAGFDASPRPSGDPAPFAASLPRLLGWLPQLAGDIHRRSLGLAPVECDPTAPYANRILHAALGEPPSAEAARALDVLLVCHADHEQNCSTTAARVASSAHADVYLCLASATGALAGPLHGGANEEVVVQLRELAANASDPAALVAAVEAGSFRLMGFGHRVYKNYDPRARVIRRTADELFAVVGEHPLLPLALGVEREALASEYFRARKLYPNVDFFSGLVYDVLGFSSAFFTVLFALGRTPGWLAHAAEQLGDKRIIRPRQVYSGVDPRALA